MLISIEIGTNPSSHPNVGVNDGEIVGKGVGLGVGAKVGSGRVTPPPQLPSKQMIRLADPKREPMSIPMSGISRLIKEVFNLP